MHGKEGKQDDMLVASLSSREREVLEHTSRGIGNAETAAALQITTHAVKYHLASIYRKLGVANRTEAAARYWEETRGGPPKAAAR
jgi:DNA-binding CsgD family transcriptional regulator